MIVGIGVDLCPAGRWRRLLDRYGERPLRRMLSEEEACSLLAGPPGKLAERAAGRWALREALGKAMGTGLSGWDMHELDYSHGRARARGGLEKKLGGMGVGKINAALSHDGGFSIAVVVLESMEGVGYNNGCHAGFAGSGGK